VTTTQDSAVDVSVVLPCLNEELGIGGVIDEAWQGIAASGRSGEVVVVDNGSTDSSAAVALAHGARVVNEPRRGYGSAYLAGLHAARGTYIVMSDADGTYDLTAIPSFVEALESHDMVLGSRLRGEIRSGAMPLLHRWIGNPMLTGLLNVLFRTKVSDAHCGLRAIRKSALPVLNLQATGMEFASEMVLKAGKRRLRIGEVPIEYRERAGESKLRTVRDGWRHLRLMLVYTSPFLFLVPGLVLLLLGLVVLLPLVGGPIHLFGRTWDIHSMVAGATATLIGSQMIQLGVFARTYAVLYLGEPEPPLERLWTRIRLEHGLLLGGVLFLCGAGLLLAIFFKWVGSGFGELHQSHPSIFGMTLVGLGVQVMFGSFFLSILGLRHHLALQRVGEDRREEPASAATKES
jgi:glycosyltransferase involved in cell wall biosynthesis